MLLGGLKSYKDLQNRKICLIPPDLTLIARQGALTLGWTDGNGFDATKEEQLTRFLFFKLIIEDLS